MNDNIILYGAGNMGKAVLELLQQKCNVYAFLDKNEELKGTSIMGVPVYHPENITDALRIQDMIVLVAMVACPFVQVESYLSKLGFTKVIPAGEYVSKFYNKITNVWKCDKLNKNFIDYFSDNESKKQFLVACDWFTGNYKSEIEIDQIDRKKNFPFFLKDILLDCKVMLDIAALEGDYIEAFLNEKSDRRAYAYILTPESVPVIQLKEKFEERNVCFFEKEAANENGFEHCQRVGLMKPFTRDCGYDVQIEKIDETMDAIPFDYLRCYSMSEVLPILKGGGTVYSDIDR